MKEWHLLSALTPVRIELNRHLAKSILELLMEVGLFPDRVSDHEPIRTPVFSIEEALHLWQDPFLWKRKSPPVAEGSVWSTWQEIHDKLSAEISTVPSGAAAALLMLRRLPELLPVDIGSLHYVGDLEIAEKLQDETASECLQLGPVTYDLRKGLPDPTWAMVFGRPYVDLIGKENLLSAPVHTAEEINDSHVLVQLTPEINDVKTDYRSFQMQRDQFKRHIGRQFFLRLKGEEHETQVPSFRFVDKIPFSRKDMC